MSSLHLPAVSVLLLSELTVTFFLKEWVPGLGSSNKDFLLHSLTPLLLTCLNMLTHRNVPSYLQSSQVLSGGTAPFLSLLAAWPPHSVARQAALHTAVLKMHF